MRRSKFSGYVSILEDAKFSQTLLTITNKDYEYRGLVTPIIWKNTIYTTKAVDLNGIFKKNRYFSIVFQSNDQTSPTFIVRPNQIDRITRILNSYGAKSHTQIEWDKAKEKATIEKKKAEERKTEEERKRKAEIGKKKAEKRKAEEERQSLMDSFLKEAKISRHILILEGSQISRIYFAIANEGYMYRGVIIPVVWSDVIYTARPINLSGAYKNDLYFSLVLQSNDLVSPTFIVKSSQIATITNVIDSFGAKNFDTEKRRQAKKKKQTKEEREQKAAKEQRRLEEEKRRAEERQRFEEERKKAEEERQSLKDLIIKEAKFSGHISILEGSQLSRIPLILAKDGYIYRDVIVPITWADIIYTTRPVDLNGRFKKTHYFSLVFQSNDLASPTFIVKPSQIDVITNVIDSFGAKNLDREKMRLAEEKRQKLEEERKRKAAEEQRRREEERKRKAAEEQRRREEEKRRAEEERLRLEEEKKKAEIARMEQKAKERARKEAHKQKVLEAYKKYYSSVDLTKKYIQENGNDLKGIRIRIDEVKKHFIEAIELEMQDKPEYLYKDLSKSQEKALNAFLTNPFTILGISSTATKNEALNILDKFKKLDRLNSIESYKAPYDLAGLKKPNRSLSIVQSAVMNLSNLENKWLAFSDPEASKHFNNRNYIDLLTKFGEEFGTYDLFLANYLYLLLEDPNIKQIELWEQFLKFFCFLCQQYSNEILLDHITPDDHKNYTIPEILQSFKSNIFKPLLQLLYTPKEPIISAVLLLKIIQNLNQTELENLEAQVIDIIITWLSERANSFISTLEYWYTVTDFSTVSDQLFETLGKSTLDFSFELSLLIRYILSPGFLNLSELQKNLIKDSFARPVWDALISLQHYRDRTYMLLIANLGIVFFSRDQQQKLIDVYGNNIRAFYMEDKGSYFNACGDNFYYGFTDKNYDQAFESYTISADEGNMHGLNGLGLCYLNGYGVSMDPVKAVRLFHSAAIKGNPDGAFNLGICYQQGKGVSQDPNEALAWYRKAYDLGHPQAADFYNHLLNLMR